MAHELSVLENITKDITVFTDGASLTAELSEDIPVVVDKIEAIHGEERITAIEAGGKRILLMVVLLRLEMHQDLLWQSI